jgi:CelD/BcsL family acetyltransferase involved in cellulose biosynthesis
MLCLNHELEVREIREIGQLETLRAQWESLWQVSEQATPFQSPAWLLPWWRHLGEGDLRFLTLWHEADLCAIAPFYIYTEPATRRRKLLLLGSGNSDYLDLLLRPEFEASALQCISSWLESTRSDWDVAEFLQLRPESPLLRLPRSDRINGEMTMHQVCPALPLPPAPQEDWRFFEQPCFKKLDYYWRRAAKQGTTQVMHAGIECVEDGLEALTRFEEQRWSRRGLRSVLSDARIQRFHRVACYGLEAAGLLRFYLLKLDGRIIASYYGFLHQERAYYYLGGFDSEFSNLSPGKLLVAYAIEQAVRERATLFDFLRGQESYKYEWGAMDRPAYRWAAPAREQEISYERTSDYH